MNSMAKKYYVLIFLSFLIILFLTISTYCQAMTIETKEGGKFHIDGKVTTSFGSTQYLDLVDDFDKGDDSDFDATRELSLRFKWEANDQLNAVASFQIGEGTTGGYFGSSDALVGGEEDGDLILELDNLFLDYTTEGGIHTRIGSQGYRIPDIAYGSHLMYETPPGVDLTVPFNDRVSLTTAWFRIADLFDDTETNTDDQADLFYATIPFSFGSIEVAPWAAYANIQEDVVKNAPSHFTYAYFDYPGLIGVTNPAITNTNPTDSVTSYYLGSTISYKLSDRLSLSLGGEYGQMNWDTAVEDVEISGYFFDSVLDYKLDWATPELFAFYGNGPDANDSDIDMMPVLIGGPTYTSSWFGGSRYNDNMFDSVDKTYATSMMAVGFKLKDIKTIDKMSHEFQIMYAEGTADDTIFEAPDDIILNEDESFVEVNFNTEYEIMKNFLAAVELGYITFDEDSDYDENVGGDVEDFWKIAWSLEYSF